MRGIGVTLMLAAITLAGCVGGDGSVETGTADVVDKDSFELQAGTGAIAGLLVDDRFRPIDLEDEPAEGQFTGFVLLQETGEQVQTNEVGEFTFVDLEPGTYTVRVQADGHEAVPQKIKVTEGVFNEVSVVARRVLSEGSTILTTEYSVFIPCGIDFVVNGYVLDCTGDLSGETFRAGFEANYSQYTDAAVLVTEMRANQDSGYEVQVRGINNGERYAVAQFQGQYVKIVNERGAANEEWNGQGDNMPWENDRDIETILFGDSPYRQELQDAGAPVCCGLGFYMGVKANFVQSLFLGPPETDIATYCVLC